MASALKKISVNEIKDFIFESLKTIINELDFLFFNLKIFYISFKIRNTTQLNTNILQI